MLYADYAATTPTSPRALDVFLRTSRETFGNPSSAHAAGRDAADVTEHARERVARMLGCDPGEVFFTSGGTESDNLALSTAAGQTILTSAIEHPAVLNTASAVAGEVLTVRPSENGAVDPEDFRTVLAGRPDVSLVSLMYANNETGVIQPVRAAAEAAHRAGALFHCDAVQGAGHTMPSVRELECDLLSVSGHKFHAPKGIGALYIRKEILPQVRPILHGGGQERGLRSGTLPVPLIAAFGEACDEAAERRAEDDRRVRLLRDFIEAELCKLPGSRVLGGGERMPGILNIAFAGTYGENLMLLCDLRGVCLSTGSACHAGDDTPSHVLAAMDVPAEYLTSSIRISVGRYTTEADAAEIVRTVRETVRLAAE